MNTNPAHPDSVAHRIESIIMATTRGPLPGDAGGLSLAECIRQGPTIVVVDDEIGMCYLVEGILTDAGYNPVVTSDPRTALELVRREKPALALIDISMPQMDGYAVMEALRSDPATSSCPVIFITGDLAFTQRLQAFRRGAREYLAKPFTADKLLAKIAKVLGDRPTGSSPS